MFFITLYFGASVLCYLTDFAFGTFVVFKVELFYFIALQENQNVFPKRQGDIPALSAITGSGVSTFVIPPYLLFCTIVKFLKNYNDTK